MLNDIEGYIPAARNIPLENRNIIMEKISSKYNGVSYDSNREYYVVGIKYKGKTYALGHHENEIECAKRYNQQAAYFNNHNDTRYVLNDIPGYVTIEKNIYEEIQIAKETRKSSKYYGVCFNKTSKKFKAYLVLNKKQITIGHYCDEVEAAKAYNKKALELNQKFKTNYKINSLV